MIRHPIVAAGLTSAAVLLPGAVPVAQAPCTASLLLQGRGDHVRTPSRPALQNATAVTYETWFRAAALPPPSGRFGVVSKGDGMSCCSNRSFDLRIKGINQQVYIEYFLTVGTTRWYTGYIFGPKVQVGKWMHVAATFHSQNREVVLYVDGVPVARKQTPVGAVVYQSSVPLTIGYAPATSTFPGEIGMVRVWNVALAPALVAAFMRIESGALPGVTASWTFDGHLFDGVGGHHCRPSGAVAFRGGCGSWANYGAPTPGPFGVPDWWLNQSPVLGQAITFTTDNKSGAPANGVFLLGVKPREAPFLGGTLLVDHRVLLPLPIASGGGSWRFQVPNTQALFGYPLFSQLLVGYPRANRIGSSRGLQMMPGR